MINDDFREPPRREDVPKSSRVRQLWPACNSDRSVRICTRSPSTHHRRGDDVYALEHRGRSCSRSPRSLARGRDPIPHTSEEWDRRRSRSPPCRGWAPPRVVSHDPLIDICRDAEDGWAPKSQETDPMVHEFGCSALAAGQPSYSPNNAGARPASPVCLPVSNLWDPMVHEFGCSALAAGQPNYSPDNAGARPASPVYLPVSNLGAGTGSPAQQARGDEILFGPGVQLGQPAIAEISDQVTRMEIDGNVGAGSGDVFDVEDSGAQLARGSNTAGKEAVYNDDYEAFSAGMFPALPEPILLVPDASAKSSRRSKREMPAPCRSSSRLAARPSPIPVAERAQAKLVRELSFLNNNSAAPDAAISAYVDLHGDDLPEDAVKAIHAATRLGNKELTRALAAIAAEAGVTESVPV